jgi:glyoxylase-like metal-dependent hydrolase (beta-lactamase superfamily II)
MAARIDRVVTSGSFTQDGETRTVENNVWLLGDDEQVLVVDPAHDLDAIRGAVGDRRVTAIACTHGHRNHVDQAPALAETAGAPVLINPEDGELWAGTHPDRLPDLELVEREVLRVAHVEIRVLHTPGHTPGSVSLYVPALESVFSGDTLRTGGPGATGQSSGDFPTILRSIDAKLLSLPPQTKVLPGHGEATTVEAEAPYRDEWTERSW